MISESNTARRNRWAETMLPRWLFYTFLALYFLTFGGHLYSGDGFSSYTTARSFIEGNGGATNTYFTDPRFTFPGPDGKLYSKYGLGQVIADVPLVLLGKALTMTTGGDSAEGMLRFLVSFLNSLVCAASVVLVLGLTRRLGYGVKTSVAVALLFGLATMNWAYSRLDFSEPLITLCYLLAARALFPVRDNFELKKSRLIWAGVWLGLAILVKPAAGLALLAVAVYLFFRLDGLTLLQKGANRRPLIMLLLKTAGWLALPLLIAAAITLWYNFYRYGKITETGYSAIADQFVAGSFYGGIYGFLLSPGKSLFLYAPGLIFAAFGLRSFFTRHRAEALFGLVLLLTYLCFYSLFWNWEGDWTWGPRYLMPAFPFMTLWAAPLLEKTGRWISAGFRSALAVGILVNVLSTLVEFNYYFYVFRKPEVGQDWRFVPELSPLRGQFYLVLSAISRAFGGPSLQMDYLAWDSERVHAIKHTIDMSPYDLFDVWWLRFLNPVEGTTNGLGGLPLSLVLGLIFGGLVWWCWRRTRHFRDIIAKFGG